MFDNPSETYHLGLLWNLNSGWSDYMVTLLYKELLAKSSHQLFLCMSN